MPQCLAKILTIELSVVSLYESFHEMLYYKDFHFLLWHTIRHGKLFKKNVDDYLFTVYD